MAIKIRLARGGSKKRPFYRIVATDSRMPRDGRFIEKLGTYNPLLRKDDEKRVTMNIERIKYWLALGAKPSDRVQRMLETNELLPKKTRNNPQKGTASKATLEKLKTKSKASGEETAAETKTTKEETAAETKTTKEEIATNAETTKEETATNAETTKEEKAAEAKTKKEEKVEEEKTKETGKEEK